jgi:predicted  nucleic acid-binding Zn-ribbon protein
MKTRKNRHTRNRTSRRRMKGGGHEQDVALITKFLLTIPDDLIQGNEGGKYQTPALSKFLDGIVPRDPDIKNFIKILEDYPIPHALAQELRATLTAISAAGIRRWGTTLGQPLLLSLAQKFQSDLTEILPVVIANPPARRANVDWLPSLQTLHSISKDYAISKAPATKSSEINANFTRVDEASRRDISENRKDKAQEKLLQSIEKFSGGIFSKWFGLVKGLVDVPSQFRTQTVSQIWELIPPGLSADAIRKLHIIFDKHTAFLAEKVLDVPLASPLDAPSGKPVRPERRVPPTPGEAAAVLAPPPPPSVPGTHVLRGELQAEPKELPPQQSPAEPEPGLESVKRGALLGLSEKPPLPARVEGNVPVLAPLPNPQLTSPDADPSARRGNRNNRTASGLPGPTPSPPILPIARSEPAPTSEPAPALASPPGQPRFSSEYTSGPLPGHSKVERGALLGPSEIPPLPARVEGNVPVLAPLPNPQLTSPGADPSVRRMLNIQQGSTGLTVQPGLNPPRLLSANQPIKPVQAPGSNHERPGKKPPAVAPPIGDLSKVFKRGDRLLPRAIVTDSKTGQPVILTVTGDYNADTRSIEVAHNRARMPVPVDVLAKEFQVIKARVQKRLFKKGDRVLIKNPRNIADYPAALRAEAQQSTCNDPFYATVEYDQEATTNYVKIVCDKGGRYLAEYNNLIYIPPGPARLTRTPGEAPPQPTPVAALADNATPLRRGDQPTRAPPSALGAPATTTECDRKLIGMTGRAETCEENLVQVKAQLEAALAAHAAETAKLQGDLEASKEALRRLDKVKNGLEADLSKTNRALATIRDMLGEQSRKLGALDTRYETLDKEKVKLEGQLTAEQGKSAGLEGQLASETQANAEEQGRLQASLAAVTSERADLTQQRGLLSAEIDRQRGELEVLERKAADLEAQFASTKALIVQKGDEIRSDLRASVAHIDSGLQIIHEGVDDVAELVREAKEQIGESRGDFVRKMNALQRELEDANLQGRQQVLAQIVALRTENQQALGALNLGLAAAMTETARLNELLRVETDAKAQAQGALAAAQAAAAEAAEAQARELAAAREASERAFAEFREASERGSEEERQRIIAEARLAMEELARELSEQQAIAVARADEAARGDLGRQLAALQAQITALPPPYVPPVAPAVVAPKITGREPPVGTPAPQGSNITIHWDARGTPGPWILRIDYDRANPDFQEVTAEGPIVYTVKRQGALLGTIYSVRVV